MTSRLKMTHIPRFATLTTAHKHLHNVTRTLCLFLSFLLFLPPALSPLSEVDDVLRRANDTEYGLASGVFTRDISKALYVSERLNAGTVFVNTYNKTDVASPFGGFKQSGFGKDLGKKAKLLLLFV